MDLQTIAWLAAGLLAVATLSRLMQAYQQQLRALLQSYVQTQREWSRKRTQASRLAQKVANAKVAEEAAMLPQQASPVESPPGSRQKTAA